MANNRWHHSGQWCGFLHVIDVIGSQKILPYTEQDVVCTEHLNIADESSTTACACDQQLDRVGKIKRKRQTAAVHQSLVQWAEQLSKFHLSLRRIWPIPPISSQWAAEPLSSFRAKEQRTKTKVWWAVLLSDRNKTFILSYKLYFVLIKKNHND